MWWVGLAAVTLLGGVQASAAAAGLRASGQGGSSPPGPSGLGAALATLLAYVPSGGARRRFGLRTVREDCFPVAGEPGGPQAAPPAGIADLGPPAPLPDPRAR